MAYKATGTYNDKDLSAADQARIAQYKADYDAAKAAGNQAKMDEAHAAAQAVRAQYGYEGGKDGSEYNSLETGKSMVSGTSGSGKTTNTGGVKTGSSANQSSTVNNANAVLNTGPMQRIEYNPSAATNQQEALAMMKQASQDWGTTPEGAARLLLERGNKDLAEQFFPGATIDKNTGVWYYNGQPLYDQDFSGSTSGVNFGGGYIPSVTEADPNIIWNPSSEDRASLSLAEKYGGGFIATAQDGSTYNIGSDDGIKFILNAQPGEQITGSDGSRWTKYDDGGIAIVTRDGKRYTIQGTGQIQAEPFEYPAFDKTFTYTPFDQTSAGQAMLQDYQNLLAKVQNYDPFEYNAEEDPLYLQYADSYTRSGQRAMQDVLGQMAARTGGYASSYAGAMAQQTYDQYMADLANKIPELRQLAYSMYVDDYNRNVDNYNRAYNQYADAYNRYAQDRNFDYGVYSDDYNRYMDQQKLAYDQYRDNISDRQWNLTNSQNQQQQALNNYWNEREWNYNTGRDTLADQRYADEIAYAREQDALNRQETATANLRDAQNDLYDRVSRGYIPIQSDAVKYGLSQEELNQLIRWAQEINRQENSRYYAYYGY